MLQNFESLIQWVIENSEGGWVLHKVKNDKGGLTYAGIAQRYHKNWEWWPVIQNPTLLAKRETQVKDAIIKKYYNEYLLPSSAHLLPRGLGVSVLDYSVNAGPFRAIKQLQSALNVTVDGKLGPITLSKINSCYNTRSDTILLHNRYTAAKQSRRDYVISRDPSQECFRKGWLKRDLRVHSKALLTDLG